MKAGSESAQMFCMDLLTAIVKNEVRDVGDKVGIYRGLLSRCIRDLKVNME